MSREKSIPKSEIIGIFTSKTKLAPDFGPAPEEPYKAWILTDSGEVVFAQKGARYLLGH